MKNTLLIYILILIIIYSCKTPYDKNYVIQCNKSNISKQEELIKQKHNRYVDSVFNSVKTSNNIKEISNFIKVFSTHDSIDKLKKIRKDLFKNKEYVINSGIDINKIIEMNPCYIPLYKNLDYIRSLNYTFDELFNSKLNLKNPYRNRYLVADLNTMNLNQKSRGIDEIYLEPKNNPEFKSLFKYLEETDISIDSLINNKQNLLNNNKKVLNQLRIYINFLEKVEKYRTEEIKKNVSSYNGYKYTGQNLCFCEIVGDTIIMIAKHATSAKGKTRSRVSMDSTTGEVKYTYSEQLPIGKNRKYYAGLYRISIKNWETQRKYEKDDIYRDSLLGGGNSRVTFFDGKSQLPNFLLMEPDKSFPRAMKMNGIHEGSLSNMSRCMLGTPQSLGCLRMTDYGSKFSRWWIPKNSNLFIYYDENLYTNKSIEEKDYIGIKLPFKDKKEGNLFRKWVNKNHPKYAKEIDLEDEGSCSNCFIQKAWEKYYKEYLITKYGKKLNFSPPKINQETNNSLIKETKKNTIESSNLNLKSKPIINKEFYTIVGCFKQQKNAIHYSNKISQKEYNCTNFFNNDASCFMVAIGPYTNIISANNEIEKIKKEIDKEAWIYTKIIN